MKYLIVGLGNIGDEYANTRHNIGFKVLDAMAEAAGVSFTTDRHAAITSMSHKGRTLVLIKPTTYMNLSGKALAWWMQAEKIGVENVLVVVDDLAIPFGALRLKSKGSDGGHNGLKHIAQTLGNQNYARLRFGIGNDYPQGRQVDYVLGEWSKDEKLLLPERISVASEMVKSFTTIGIERTMAAFNGK